MPKKKQKAKTTNHAQAAAYVTSTTVEPIETVRVLFQAGILDPLQLSAAYTEIIDALANGYYKSVTFKKLRGYDNIYAARVNISDRLLFTFEIIDGKRYLVLIGVIDNHAYEKSSLLTPGGLKQFLIKYRHAIHASLEKSRLAATPAAASAAASSKNDLNEEEDDDSDFSDVDVDNDPCLSSFQSNQSSKSVEFWPSVFFKDKFNPLSLEQKLLQDQGFPKLCTGPAGSGKSCAAFVEMEKALAIIRRMKEDDPEFDTSGLAPIAYVTQSPILLRQMKKEWEEMHPSGTIVPVKFQTYDDFLLEQDPTLNGRQVGDEQFKAWLKAYLANARKMPRAKKISTPSFITTLDPDDNDSKLFEEFEIIAGCEKPTDYFKLGNRECHFHDKDEKSVIFNIYKEYVAFLNSSNKYDARLFTLSTVKPNNTVTIIDEAHDLSQRQLLTLSAGTVNNSLCILMDPYQRLNRLISTIPFVEKYFTSLGKGNATHRLTPSFRCPKIMTDIATSLISARNICATGTPNKGAETSIISAASQRTTTGEAHIIDPDDAIAFASTLAKLRELENNELLVIITPDEHRKEAERKFPSFLILTPSEAKGMEYHTVVLFRCFTGQRLSELNRMLMQTPDATAPAHRSKNAEAHIDTRAINELYVSVTRATDRIYCLDIETRNNSHLFGPIKRLIAATKTEPLATPSHVSASVENREINWLEKIQELILTNNLKQITYAKSQYLRHQLGDEASFNALLVSMQTLSSAAAAPLVSAATTLTMAASPVTPAQPLEQKQAASLKTAKQPLPAQAAITSNDRDTGIQSLLTVTNFTQNNLTSYLKHSNAYDLFFRHYTTDSGHKKVLLLEICSDKSKLGLLIDCLEINKELYSLFNPTTFFNDDLFDNKTQCQDWKYSIFHMLCRISGGERFLIKHNFLSCILRNNEIILNMVSNSILTNKIYPDGTSAFMNLICTPFGRQVLHGIIWKNPWIVNKEIMLDLLATLPASFRGRSNAISNYIDLLMQEPPGINLLCACIATFPEILSHFDNTRLNRLLLGDGLSSENALSLLGLLFAQQNGRRVVTTIASRNPAFAPLVEPMMKDISAGLAEDLCYADTLFKVNSKPIIDGKEEIENCLNQFTISNLEAVLKHPNAESLLFDAAYPSQLSLFQELVERHLINPKDSIGFQPFLDLFAANPEYSSLFTKERLESRFKSKELCRASNLCVLLFYGKQTAVKILTIALNKNPNLGAALSLEALARVYFEFRDASDQPCSPLSHILQISDHRLLIDMLSIYYASKAPTHTGPVSIPRSFAEAMSVSSFFKVACLSCEDDQHQFLLYIFSDPNSLKLLTPEILLTPISTDPYNRTVLQALVSTSVGKKFIHRIFQQNMKITTAITRKDLDTLLKHQAERDPDIIALLNTLYEKKPSLRDRRQNNGAPADVVVSRDRPSAAPSQTLFSPATATSLTSQSKQPSSTQVNASVYFDKGLSIKQSEGIQRLLTAFTPNNLIQYLLSISAHALFFNYYTTDSGLQKILLLEICSNISKTRILLNTLEENKELYNGLFRLKTFFNNDPSLENKIRSGNYEDSIFHMLCNANCESNQLIAKHELLRNILRYNSTLLNAISSKELLKGKAGSDSAFMHLIKSNFGTEVLYIIAAKNPWVIDIDLMNHLFEKLPSENSDICAIDYLFSHQIGTDFLCECIATLSEILLRIQVNGKIHLLKENVQTDQLVTLFKSVCNQSSGRPIVELIARENPEFAPLIKPLLQEISPDNLAIDLCYPDTPYLCHFNSGIDEQELVLNCQDKFTTAHLEALFNDQHAESLLFDAPSSTRTNLFRHLVRKLVIASNITSGLRPFLYLLTKNPAYARIFTKERLESRFANMQSFRESNLSILLHHGKEITVQILIILFNYNPQLADTLSIEALTRAYPSFRNPAHQPCSPLYVLPRLTDHRLVIDMLKLLLRQHFLNNTVPIDISRIFIDEFNVSYFFNKACISNDTEQHTFLLNLFSNPDAIRMLTPEMMLTPIPNDIYKRNRTALQALTSTEVGCRQLLPLIFQHNFAIATAITPAILVQLFNHPFSDDNPDKNANRETNLVAMFSTPGTSFIMSILIEKNPRIGQNSVSAPAPQAFFQPATSAALETRAGTPKQNLSN